MVPVTKAALATLLTLALATLTPACTAAAGGARTSGTGTGTGSGAGTTSGIARGSGDATVARLPATVYSAHRGGAKEVPENSMAGLRAAYRRGTAQVLDVDVRRLGDGTLVAMHDATLDRTTDGHGPVRDLDLAAWRHVRLRPPAALPGRWRPEHPPTLAQVLDRFGGRIVLNLELKDEDGLRRMARMLRKRSLTRSVYVQSHDLSLAPRAHRLGLLTSVWRSAAQLRTDRPARWRDDVDMLSVDHRARDADIRRAARSGIARVWSHTVDTPAARDRVLRLGCDGVVTDAPALLARTRARMAAQRATGPVPAL